MNSQTRAMRSARLLAADMDRLRTALSIRDGAMRRLALRDYYFQIPSRGYEFAFIGFNTAASAGFLAWITHSFALHRQQLWFLPLAIVAAFFIADVISAAFHKWWDSYAGEDHWLWGTGARAFRIHHEFPNNLDELPFLNTMAPLAPIMASFNVAFCIGIATFHLGPLACFTVWLMIQLFSIGTEIHKQGHLLKSPTWVRVMKRAGLFLRPSVHNKHHRGGRDTDYGIINGWSNPLLNRLDVWNRLDLFLWRRYGLFPRNWIQGPRTIPASVLTELKANPSLVPEALTIYMNMFPRRCGETPGAPSARSPAHCV